MITKLDFDEVKLFLSESNRQREEKFLRGITDNYKNKLKFTQNTCTDGNLVQVNPNHPFIHNLKAVKEVLEELQMLDNAEWTTWLLLKIFSRGGTAHEAFHILFTDFRTLERMNREFKNQHSFKGQIMHNIMNIGEDSFIELAGINFLPGLEFYITFSNFLAYENTPTLEEIEAKCKKKELPWINLFLHWAMMYAIIGKVKGKVKNRKVKNRMKKTAPIFDKIRFEKDCNKRYEYAKEIYFIVEDLVEDAINEHNMPDFNYFKNNILPKLKEALETEVEIKKDFDSRNGNGQGQSIQQDSSNEEKKDNQNPDGNGSSQSNSNKKEDKKDDGSGKGKKEGQKEKDEKSGNGQEKEKNQANSQNDSNSENGEDADGDSDNEMKSHNTSENQSDSTHNKKDSIDIDKNAEPTDANPQGDTEDSDKADDSEAAKEEALKKKKEELDKLLKEIEGEKSSVAKDEAERERIEKREQELEMKQQRELTKIQYSRINAGIHIVTNKNFEELDNQEIIYERIYNQHRGLIQKFANMFLKLIKDQSESWENRLMIGSALDTRRLADPKMRIWKKENDKRDVADLSIQLLIDGSGSMQGKLHEVIQATIILYEVAKKLNIPISIVEERAIYGSPKVVHNVLVDYRNYKNATTKYNILHLSANGGTREGVSLKWASAYQDLQPNKDKLLIVLADGNPEHTYGGQSYTGRVSASDTKMVADQIQKKGTKIVAISLGEYCYPYLKQIYNNTILCDDLTKLPDLMIRVLKRCMFK